MPQETSSLNGALHLCLNLFDSIFNNATVWWIPLRLLIVGPLVSLFLGLAPSWTLYKYRTLHPESYHYFNLCFLVVDDLAIFWSMEV